MDTEDLLAGLDGPGWAELDAGRVAGWLREMTTAGPDYGMGMIDESDCVLNLEVVYPGTVLAMPYLGRFIEAGVQAPLLVDLLGEIAEMTREGGLSRSSGFNRQGLAVEVYTVFLEQLPVLLRAAREGDQETRFRFARAAPRFAQPGLVLPVLRERWTDERDPVVRMALLHSLVELTPEIARGTAEQVLAEGEADPVRAVAVAVLIEFGAPWTPALADTFVETYGTSYRVLCWLGPDSEVFDRIIDALVDRGDWRSACDLVEAVLRHWAGQNHAWVCDQAIDHAGSLCKRFPSARSRLQPILTAMLTDATPAEESRLPWKATPAQNAARLLKEL